jgi:D-alanyl-D-alanine carboxypeptidase
MQDAAGAWNCAQPADFTTLSSSIGGSDSGVVTDIADLGRYAQALASGALVTPESARFDDPLPVAADQPSWLTTAGGAYQAGSLVGQYGSVPGYITAAFADPATGMSIAVVLNNSGANPAIGAWLAWELAAIASKAPAASGQTAPEAGLPWTAQQWHDAIAANAICAPPAA